MDSGATVTLPIPTDCRRGIIISTMYIYNYGMTGVGMTLDTSSGIVKANHLIDAYGFSNSGALSVWVCQFKPGEEISVKYKNTNYTISDNILAIIY